MKLRFARYVKASAIGIHANLKTDPPPVVGGALITHSADGVL